MGRESDGLAMISGDHPVIRVLSGLGVPYELIEIDPTFADTAAFCEKYGYRADHSGNTIVVASRKEPKKYVACVALATTRLDVNNRVRKLLGVSKASFATAEEMRSLTGMEVGGVTPFSLPESIPLYVDERIMDLEYVILGGGSRDFKVKISPDVFLKLGGRVVSDLARPAGGNA